MFDRVSGKLGRNLSINVSYAGRMTAVITRGSVASRRWPTWDSGPILPNNWTYDRLSRESVSWKNTDVVWPNRDLMGFGWPYHSMYLNIPNSDTGWHPQGLNARSWGTGATGLMVPHWFVVLIFAFLASTSWMKWSYRFSLRTLLIATTLVAVVLGFVASSSLVSSSSFQIGQDVA